MKLPSLLALTVAVTFVLASSHAIASNDKIINVKTKSNKAFDTTRAEARLPFERDMTVKKSSASAWATFVAKRDAASAAAKGEDFFQVEKQALPISTRKDYGDGGHEGDHPSSGSNGTATSLTKVAEENDVADTLEKRDDKGGPLTHWGGHGGSGGGGGVVKQVDKENDVAGTLETRDDNGGPLTHWASSLEAHGGEDVADTLAKRGDDGRANGHHEDDPSTGRLTSKRNTDSGMVKQVDELVLREDAPQRPGEGGASGEKGGSGGGGHGY